MSKKSLTIQNTNPRMDSEWASSPDMIEIYLTPEFLKKAEKCVAFMQENDIAKMIDWWAMNYELFDLVDDDTDLGGKDVIKGEDGEYVVFDPEYQLDGCHAHIYKDGTIGACFPFKHTSDELYVTVGKLDDLKVKMESLAEAGESDQILKTA